jgi:hypothetical protein
MSTLQLGLGHISSAPGRSDGPMLGEAVTCPLRGVTVTVSPSSGPKSTRFGGGLLPPGLTHCRSAVPPDAVRNISVATFHSPAALKLAVRLKSS